MINLQCSILAEIWKELGEYDTEVRLGLLQILQ